MALNTYSKFWYGIEINTQNIYFDFNEGAGEISASLTSGLYSLGQIAVELERALNDVAVSNTYNVNIDRDNRKLIISSSGTFSILAATGSHYTSGVYSVIGFNGSDKTGLMSYTSDNVVGLEYKPQFYLLDYQDPEANQYAVDGVINETASGRMEVVRYGIKKIMTCTIEYITNNHHASDSYIRTNVNGYNEAKSFMEFLVRKGAVEFMSDESDVNTYYTLVLEKTLVDQIGLGFKINEINDKLGYYTTGLLTFRVIEV